MQDRNGLVCAYSFGSDGGAKALAWEQAIEWQPKGDFLWIHADYAAENVRDWLTTRLKLGPRMSNALLAHDPRPRCTPVGDGLMLVVRGVNLNEGADPEDMVSLRVWVDAERVITLRHRKLHAIRALRDDIEAGRSPGSPAELVVDIIERLLHRIGLVVDKLDDDVDDIEDQVLSAEEGDLRHRVAEFRRSAIAIRRHIAPQREVLSRLQSERLTWLDEEARARLRECAERLARIVDELDSAKERAMVTSEELTSQLSDLMNRRLYGLSIVAAIFLPLGFITGAFGVNLGGIPGTNFGGSFWIMCAIMVGLTFCQVWFFRRRGWF